jgi:hypothetical protein
MMFLPGWRLAKSVGSGGFHVSGTTCRWPEGNQSSASYGMWSSYIWPMWVSVIGRDEDWQSQAGWRRL